MLTMLGGLAEFERELIRARTGEGRARAKARGVKLGRTPKLTVHQKREALARRESGEPVREIARSYDVSHSTISRLGRETVEHPFGSIKQWMNQGAFLMRGLDHVRGEASPAGTVSARRSSGEPSLHQLLPFSHGLLEFRNTALRVV
jgi:hypothetical protein